MKSSSSRAAAPTGNYSGPDQAVGPLYPKDLTPRKLTVTTRSRRHTIVSASESLLSLAVTNSPCCTGTQKPMPSDSKKSYIQQ